MHWTNVLPLLCQALSALYCKVYYSFFFLFYNVIEEQQHLSYSITVQATVTQHHSGMHQHLFNLLKRVIQAAGFAVLK